LRSRFLFCARVFTPRTASANIAIRVGVVCASLCAVASEKNVQNH
jgi:hypothetical protein